MVFTSPVFLFLFLPFVLGMYFLLRKAYRNAFLFIVSSVFYFYGEQKLLLLMYLVILVNYLTGLALGWLQLRQKNNKLRAAKAAAYKRFVIMSCVTFCLALLWYFKYWNFTLLIFQKLADVFGFAYRVSQVDKIILPLGISFYTFHCLSYSLDVYMNKMPAEKSLLRFATYVLMFPQLVAGPIVRYADIQRQFIERSISAVGFANGLRRFCFGFAKKVLLANVAAKAVDKIFALPTGSLDWATAWVGAVCYTLQIYFDFSGYSDMAIGLAALFGFHYKENFNYPYISRSVGEFWRRWHISLSTWLRDYVYINLGGNRVSPWRYNANVLLVFLLSGLWHGANFTFVLWGIWYGVFIILENLFLQKYLKNKTFLAHFYTLLVIVFGWVLFRADSVGYALRYWGKMLSFDLSGAGQASAYLQNDILLAMVLGALLSYDWRVVYKRVVLHFSAGSHQSFLLFKLLSYGIAASLFLLSLTSVMSSTYNPFIYFRF